jgi:hypothetical protein
MTKTPDDRITVILTRKEAERLSYGLSDLLCWARGFCAAQPDRENLPLGMTETRDMNSKLKGAME